MTPSDATIPVESLPSGNITGAAIWDRAWRHRPEPQRDDALLAREECSPRFECVLRHLEATFGSLKGLRTIELGSGRGDLSAILARRGADVTLLDQSEAALREARWRFARLGISARYATGDLLQPLHDWRDEYDVSMSYGVIEHFKGAERTRVIRAHREVLAPGGMAVISVPNACCIPYRLWKSYLQCRGWWPYGMELPYTKREIERRARHAGFSRSVTRSFGFWQSVGDHWAKRFIRKAPDWGARRSALDEWMGFILLLLAWRDESRLSAPGEVP